MELYLAQQGLTASWQTKYTWANFKFLKFIIDQLFAVFNKVTALLEQYECDQVGIFGKSVLR